MTMRKNNCINCAMALGFQTHRYQIIIVKFSQSEMDFLSTLVFESAGCSVITFGPSEVLERQCYHRNTHSTPLLNPFWPHLIVRQCSTCSKKHATVVLGWITALLKIHLNCPHRREKSSELFLCIIVPVFFFEVAFEGCSFSPRNEFKVPEILMFKCWRERDGEGETNGEGGQPSESHPAPSEGSK